MAFGIGGDVGGFLDDALGLTAANQGAQQASQLAQFKPFNISGGLGNVSFSDGAATTNLDPRLQGFSNLLGSGASAALGLGNPLANAAQDRSAGFLNQLNLFDPFQAAQTQFNRLEEILNPGRQRAQSDLENKLLAQGRLGSTGGGLQQEALNTAIEQSRRQGLFDAFTQAQQTQQNLAGLGTSLGSFGEGLLSSQQNRGLGLLNGMLGIEQIPLQLLNAGGQLGGLGAQAGANQGQFVSGAANRESDLLGNFFSSGLSSFAIGI